MVLVTPPLALIEARTLGHYEESADAFWEGTRQHDVSQSRAVLLAAVNGARRSTGGVGARILDFGCGPGRDLVAFRELGAIPTGLDGCRAFVEMARLHGGSEVLHQSFFALDLGQRRFDGVFANASLFHVPSSELPRVLSSLWSVLEPGGVLFCCNPRSFGVEQEGFSGARYGCHLTAKRWTQILSDSGFVVERCFFRPDSIPEAERPWVAHVARRPLSP